MQARLCNTVRDSSFSSLQLGKQTQLKEPGCSWIAHELFCRLIGTLEIAGALGAANMN